MASHEGVVQKGCGVPGGCGRRTVAFSGDLRCPASVQDHRAAIERFRKQKDEAFQKAEWSPIPAPEREDFPGLVYYPVDPRYRFEVPLEPAEPRRIEFPLSTGGTQVQERVGVFVLRLPEGPVELAAYRGEAHADGLFLPFRDRTSGTESYGGGRYLDVPELGPGRYAVDLNLAYHPYCAYNDAYACPLPPPENWLQVPMRVGERLPDD